jgi:guanylate kinase
MRPNEVEGRDYFFVDRPKFEGWIRDDMLLEHANVYGDYKGIPRQQVSVKTWLGAVLEVKEPNSNGKQSSQQAAPCFYKRLNL